MSDDELRHRQHPPSQHRSPGHLGHHTHARLRASKEVSEGPLSPCLRSPRSPSVPSVRGFLSSLLRSIWPWISITCVPWVSPRSFCSAFGFIHLSVPFLGFVWHHHGGRVNLSRSLFEFCLSRNPGEREGRKEGSAGSFDVIGSGGWE